MTGSRKDALLDTAVRLFYEQGCHATGIDRLLAEAGVAKMTLYKHFPSKDDLILAAATRLGERHQERLVRYVESRGPAPHDRLLAVFDFLEHWVRQEDFCGCPFVKFSTEYPEAEHPVHRAVADYKERQRLYFQSLARAAGVADIEGFTERFLVLVDGAVALTQVTGRNEPIRVARETISAMLGDATDDAGRAGSGLQTR